MAFGIRREELKEWKRKASNGEIAFITHFWYDPRFPDCDTVTKVGCSNVKALISWGKQYGLKEEWIHLRKPYPHFDLLGEKQAEILQKEGKQSQLLKLKKRNHVP
ncbi:hypothetical protein ACFPU1_03695 [Thalassorhabdus alkalitolerans]|uniref:Uncharacterized protein n=1 Tax=Thalassorhabdus alkalitolerans TaxID=2282697 RepID=A0ABW0YKF7_9BACI